ncbi:hypothetical protein [Roseibium sp.]|uniref:hypothetical protein n=1 Tax=Roseibium sp. TaxID=1936156 RepID=UPI003B51D151
MPLNLSQFLLKRHLSIDAITEGLCAALGFEYGDILIAVGSLAEELGNERSDFDIMLVTSRTNFTFTYPNVIVATIADITVDIAVVQNSWATQTINKIKSFGDNYTDPRNAGEFSRQEIQFLHRVCNCMVLAGHDSASQLRAQIAFSHLIRQRFSNAFHELKCLVVDLVGFEEERDWQSCIMVAQLILDYSIECLLASFQLTNPSAKWRARLLGKIPQNWEDRLPGAFSKRSAITVYYDLLRSPTTIDTESAQIYCNKICSFMRKVLALGSWRTSNDKNDTDLRWYRGETGALETFPVLDSSIFFYYQEETFIGFNLRHKEPYLHKLSPKDVGLLCYYDGGTHAVRSTPAVAEMAKKLGILQPLRDGPS